MPDLYSITLKPAAPSSTPNSIAALVEAFVGREKETGLVNAIVNLESKTSITKHKSLSQAVNGMVERIQDIIAPMVSPCSMSTLCLQL